MRERSEALLDSTVTARASESVGQFIDHQRRLSERASGWTLLWRSANAGRVLMLRQTDTAPTDDSGIDAMSGLEALFTPSCVVVIGASDRSNLGNLPRSTISMWSGRAVSASSAHEPD